VNKPIQEAAKPLAFCLEPLPGAWITEIFFLHFVMSYFHLLIPPEDPFKQSAFRRAVFALQMKIRYYKIQRKISQKYMI